MFTGVILSEHKWTASGKNIYPSLHSCSDIVNPLLDWHRQDKEYFIDLNKKAVASVKLHICIWDA